MRLQPPWERCTPAGGAGSCSDTHSLGQTAQRSMHLKPGDIVSVALSRRLGWDMRHHFMAEKIVDRFGLKLPGDRELVRQLAVVFVREGLTAPPEWCAAAADAA